MPVDQYLTSIEIFLKLLMAMVCGGAVGFERELSRKAAGLRTNVLICIGAALYMIVSRHISGGAPYTDPARLVAQVVAGIGFLGAGVILQSRGSVTGLTTAATIFVVGAIGISIGEGLFVIATFSTVLIIVVLVLLRRVEHEVLRRKRLFHYTLNTQDPAEFLEQLLDTLEREHLRLEDFDVRELKDGLHEVRVGCITSVGGNRRLLQSLNRLGKDLRSSTRERPE
ncbi:MAG TPA: MgtC/SapB family protein [Pyrinomonadaceae bacterium]